MATKKKEVEQLPELPELMEKKQEKKEEMKMDSKKMEYLTFNARVVRAFHGATRYDREECNRITVFSEDMPYTDIWAFDECGNKYTPSWLKDADGYMNLKSNFDIPVKDSRGKKISFDDWIESETTTGALVVIKIRQKEGAIYPMAVKILQDGENVDPFEDM